LTDAVRRLLELRPKFAIRVDGNGQEKVAVDALLVGDLVLVKPGEGIPSDGVVVEGASAVNEAWMTGESVPVEKVVGSQVFGSTIVEDGALMIRIERVGKETALQGIVRAVEAAQGSKAPIARLADRVSAIFVPVVLALALVTFGVWFFVDSSDAGLTIALERFVSVLVIACPCALGLATPAAVAVATGRGAELFVLFKGGEALEATANLQTLFLDKTGTLTRGEPELVEVVTNGVTEGELLSWVASVEKRSNHPISRALTRGGLARGGQVDEVDQFRAVAGAGVAGIVGGRLIHVGTAAWLASLGISSSEWSAHAEKLAREGKTPVFAAVDGVLRGVLALLDQPMEYAKSVVALLRREGYRVVLLSGDRITTSRAIASEVGIEEVIAEVSPIEKADAIRREQSRGVSVAMIGDGVNDAPALALADVGIAMGGGSEVAIATGDVALMKGGLETLHTALALSRRTMKTIQQNLFWASVYNIVGIPLAAGALYPWTGWQLSPILSSLAMSLSSVSVLANSLRLSRFSPPRAAVRGSELR
jgi:Cu+-exporting ATPase